jgi:dipeptidase
MLAAGKKATADGSVMVARNCDTNSTEAQRILSVPRKTHAPDDTIKIPDSITTIPQVPVTYAYSAIARVVNGADIEMVAGGINEFQVSAGASSGGQVSLKVSALTPFPATVIGDYMMTLVLQRCKTAREGIRLMGELTEKYGARKDNYIVADPNEAWLFEQYQGYHWVAARVPDDCFVVEANSVRLAEINPDDPDNYLCDPGLIPFAVQQGLWDPASGKFHASRAYGSPDVNRPRGTLPQPYYSLHRVWRGCMLLKPSANLDPYEPTKEYPLFMKPDRKLTPQDFLNVLKDYYQGTELDEYGAQDKDFPTVVDAPSGIYRLAPAWCRSRIIGCPQTVTSWVTQSRAWLPNEIGGILWGGLASGATSPHLPWYACNTRTPKAYQVGNPGTNSVYMPDSAYWMFETTGNIMNLFYQGTMDLVKPVWEQFDCYSFQRQPAIEETALKLLPRDPVAAAEFLTTYSNSVAQEALTVVQDMFVKLFTRIALLNNPQTGRGYEDLGYGKSSATVY